MPREPRSETAKHQCSECHTPWRKNVDGTWSVANDAQPEACCDNVDESTLMQLLDPIEEPRTETATDPAKSDFDRAYEWLKLHGFHKGPWGREQTLAALIAEVRSETVETCVRAVDSAYACAHPTDRNIVYRDEVAARVRSVANASSAEPRRPTATAAPTQKAPREFILDDMSGHAENDCPCNNHEECNQAMAVLVRRLLIELRRERDQNRGGGEGV